MKIYSEVGRGNHRPFAITGGLVEGYGHGGHVHPFDDVIWAHRLWQSETGVILGCHVQPMTLSYGWTDEGSVRTATEPGWILAGSFNPIYDATLTDADAWDRLMSLAARMGDRLGQTRIYVEFAGEIRVFQAVGESTPTEVKS